MLIFHSMSLTYMNKMHNNVFCKASQAPTPFLHAWCLRSWLAASNVSLDPTASNDYFLSSFQLQHFYMTVMIASKTHPNASRRLTQTLLDCILNLTHYLFDPGTLPSSANQCILGKVYLRSIYHGINGLVFPFFWYLFHRFKKWGSLLGR